MPTTPSQQSPSHQRSVIRDGLNRENEENSEEEEIDEGMLGI